MEETKAVEAGTGSGGSSCGYKCDMHKLCFKHCCLVKCIVSVLVVFAVFALGFAAGVHCGYRGHGGWDGRWDYRHTMMYYGGGQQFMGDAYRGGYGPEDGRMMYRMMGQPVSRTIQIVSGEAFPQ